MSYEEKQQPSAKTHSISMENRTKLSVTGVEDLSLIHISEPTRP